MIALVIGGARSGKSAVAERLALRRAAPSGVVDACPLTYVATAVYGSDEGFDRRIEAHRKRRGSSWTTIEVGLGERLSPALTGGGVALVDSVGVWVAGWPGFAADLEDLLGALSDRRRRQSDTVLVTDEAGLSVHPATSTGSAFRDALGEVNAGIAAVADHVLLVVAGRVLRLPTETEALAALESRTGRDAPEGGD